MGLSGPIFFFSLVAASVPILFFRIKEMIKNMKKRVVSTLVNSVVLT